MPDASSSLRIVSPRRNLIIIAVLCALFTAMGVVILLLGPTRTLNVVVGAAAIGLFGLGGGYAIFSQLRRSVLLTADEDGLRITGAGAVPWADVDRIGSTPTGLGIRLRRYDAYLAGVRGAQSPAELRAARKANDGWDVLWPPRLLDRSPAEAARALERLRSRA
jgi:hypothetical protein